MSKKQYPHEQPFNVKAVKNQTKVKAWFQVGKTNNKKFGGTNKEASDS